VGLLAVVGIAAASSAVASAVGASPAQAVDSQPRAVGDGPMMHLFKTVIAPYGGVLGSTALAAGPFPHVMRCRRDRSLGETNPDLFPWVWGNGVAWASYGIAAGNPFLFFSNFTGVVLGCLYVLTAIHLAPSGDVRLRLERVTVGIVATWITVCFYASRHTAEDRNQILGMAANVLCFLMFAAPLSSAARVVQSKNASSINKPFALLTVANCCLWMVFGMAIHDTFVWLPNVFGLVLGSLQILLIVLYPGAVAVGASRDDGIPLSEVLLTENIPRAAQSLGENIHRAAFPPIAEKET